MCPSFFTYFTPLTISPQHCSTYMGIVSVMCFYFHFAAPVRPVPHGNQEHLRRQTRCHPHPRQTCCRPFKAAGVFGVGAFSVHFISLFLTHLFCRFSCRTKNRYYCYRRSREEDGKERVITPWKESALWIYRRFVPSCIDWWRSI